MTEETRRCLASALRTDRSSFRLIEPQDPDVIVLRELNKTRQELVAERIRCINRFRELLWRYYPQFTEILDEEIRAWHLELWELIPCPGAVKKKKGTNGRGHSQTQQSEAYYRGGSAQHFAR